MEGCRCAGSPGEGRREDGDRWQLHQRGRPAAQQDRGVRLEHRGAVALVNLTTGSVVSSFVAPGFGTFGNVNDMVKVGNRLVLGGNFTLVGGKAHAGIAALNATRGAVDHTWMNIQFKEHDNNTGSGA